MKLFTSNKIRNVSIDTKSEVLDYNIFPDWIYGIKIKSIKDPIKYLNSGVCKKQLNYISEYENSSNENDIFMYISGKVVILYFKSQNKQAFYLNHNNEIISVCSSLKNERICASAEACLNPSIHIWTQENQSTIKILNGYHQEGIHLISFSHNAKYILTVGQRDPSSVIIIDWVNNISTLSVLLGYMAQDLDVFETGEYSLNYNFKDILDERLCNSLENDTKIKDKNYLSQNIKFYSSVIALITTDELYCFYFNKSGVSHVEFDIDRNLVQSPFLSVCIVPTENNFNDNKSNIDNDINKLKEKEPKNQKDGNSNNLATLFEKMQFNVVTGHLDGSLIKWNPQFGYSFGILKKYMYPINSLVYFNKGLVIPQPTGKLLIWDKFTRNESMELDLTYSLNLISTKIISVVTNFMRKKIMIITLAGEIYEIKFDPKQQPEMNKLSKIFLIDNINVMSLTNEERPNILFGGNNKIFSVIDSENNEIVYMNYIKESIVSIDSVILQNSDIKVVIGTEEGNLFVIKNWSDFPVKVKHCFKKRINDVKFSYDDSFIIACSGNSISMMFMEEIEDSFDYIVSKRFELSDSEPICFGLSEKFNLLIVLTTNYKLFQINLKDYSIFNIKEYDKNEIGNELEDKGVYELINSISKTNWQSFTLKNPINSKVNSLFNNIATFGNILPIVIGSFEGESFHVWKDFYSINGNSSDLFKIHNSVVQGIKFSIDDSLFFSAGNNDGMICKWNVNVVLNDDSCIWNNFSEKFKNKDDVIINNILIIKEISYCEMSPLFESYSLNSNISSISSYKKVASNFKFNSYSLKKDNNILIKGFTNKLLTTLFSTKKKYNILGEKNKISNDIIGKNMIIPQNFIEVDYVYASHIGELRDSVQYIHFSKILDKDEVKSNYYNEQYKKLSYFNKEQENLLKNLLNEDFDKKSINELIAALNFSRLREEIAHYKCEKNIIYFHSRFGIIYEPYKKIQYFYQGHKNRISCFSVDSFNNLIATAEAVPFSNIHIWNPKCQTVHIIDSGHINEIKILKFSSKGKYLLSIDNENSIQIFLNFKSIAYKNTGKFPIINAKFFYCDFYSEFKNREFNIIGNLVNTFSDEIQRSPEGKFITLGYRNITIWEIIGSSLIKLKMVSSQEFILNEEVKCYELKIFTCVDFLDYVLNNKIETDILIGSTFGDISAITCNKYVVIKSGLHDGAINCIKVTDLIIEKKYVVITAGEDGLVKIFDQKLQEIKTINPYLYNNLEFSNGFERIHKGIQSLDLHTCNPGKFTLLLGFRCGDLIEIEVDRELYNDLKIKSDVIENENELISASHIYSYNYFICSNLKNISDANEFGDLNSKLANLLFVVHSKLPIIFAICKDKIIRIIDYAIGKVILMKDLGQEASVMTLSEDSKILAIGMTNGLVALFDCNMSVEGKTGKYTLPNLRRLQFIIGFETKVIHLKFSSESDFLTISYDNYSKNHKSGKTGGSILSIYIMRISNIIQSSIIKTNSNDLYIKLYDIDIPESYITAIQMNKKECGITGVNFSEDDQYLLISINKISSIFDENYFLLSNKNQENYTIYVIWDIKNGNILLDQEELAKIKFSCISRPNSIFHKPMDYFFQSFLSIKKMQKENEGEFYIGNEISGQVKQHKNTFDQISINSMINSKRNDYLGYYVLGSSNGNISFIRKNALSVDYSEIGSFDTLKISSIEMNLARTYAGHSSSVTNLFISNESNYLFSSSLYDQAIIQYKIIEEDLFSDADYFNLPMIKDPFLDVMSKTEFILASDEYWMSRETIKDVYYKVKHFENEDNDIVEDIDLELTYISGRKAIDRRNNLYYDLNNRFVYSTSSYIIFMKIIVKEVEIESSNDKVKKSIMMLKQEKLLPIDNFDTNIQKEISCFSLSKNKKLIGIGHNGYISNVSVWEINTECLISSIPIPYVSIISILKFSTNNEKIIVSGVHKLYYNVIIMIDINTSTIESVWLGLNTLPFKIKDIEFLENNVNNFLTVGIQHFAIWRINGENMEYSNIPMAVSNYEDEHYFDQNDESNKIDVKNNDHIFGNLNKVKINNDKEKLNLINDENEDFSKIKLISKDPNKFGICLLEDRDKIFDYAKSMGYSNPEEKSKLTHLGLILIDNSIITCTDTGYLYVFSFERVFLSFKIKTHESPIMSMDYNSASYMFITGAMDGTSNLYGAILNKKKCVTSIKKLMVFNTFNNLSIPLKERIMNVNYNIQSVSIGINKICIGTRSGIIFEFVISEDTKIILNNTMNNNIETNQINDKIDNTKLLSTKSKSNCIKFQDNDPPISLDFDLYSTRIFTLTSQGNFRVWSLIDFQIGFEYEFKNKALQTYHFRSHNILLLIFEYQIIALDTNQKDNYSVHQYKRVSNFEIQIGQILEVKISPSEKIIAVSLLLNNNPTVYIYDILNGLSLKNIMDKFESYIKNIDFSVDSNYLILEDYLGGTFYFEIQTRRNIIIEDLIFEVEWMNDGLKYSDKFRCLHNVFGTDLVKITKICKHPNGKIVAVGDYLGVLRLFIYPSEEHDTYFLCRTDHTAKISHIVWSNDMKYLATLSDQDRTIYIYRII